MLKFLLIVCFLVNVDAKVVLITDNEYESFLNKHKMVFIKFFSPNCGHCKSLAPTYVKLGDSFEARHLGVTIAEVDCTSSGKNTCQQEGVRGYPTLRLISMQNGNKIVDEYDGNRAFNDMVKFLQKKARPAIEELDKTTVSKFIESDGTPVVVGFFNGIKSDFYAKLVQNVPMFRSYYTFGYTFDKQAADELGQKIESIVIYRPKKYKSPLEESVLVLSNKEEVEKFLEKNKFSLVDYMSPVNNEVFDGLDLVVVYVPFDVALVKSKFKQVRARIIKEAKKYDGLRFVISQRQDYSEFVNGAWSGASERDLHIVGIDKSGEKYVCDQVASLDDLKTFESILATFAENFKKGGVYKPYVKSELVPTDDTTAVKVVVGKTFESVVMDDSKDVLIEVYAPWCGHCQKLAPIYEEVAQKVSSVKSLVIAKIDGTSNDVPKTFPVQGFPTIYFAKSGQKSKPISYDGPRTVDGMIDWLKKHSSFPEDLDTISVEEKAEL